MFSFFKKSTFSYLVWMNGKPKNLLSFLFSYFLFFFFFSRSLLLSLSAALRFFFLQLNTFNLNSHFIVLFIAADDFYTTIVQFNKRAVQIRQPKIKRKKWNRFFYLRKNRNFYCSWCCGRLRKQSCHFFLLSSVVATGVAKQEYGLPDVSMPVCVNIWLWLCGL